MTSRTPIGHLLVEAGIISVTTLERVLIAQEGSSKRLGEILNGMGLVTEGEITEALTRQKEEKNLRERILLLDPAPEATERLREALTREGYDVMSAHDGIEGLKLAFLRSPGVVICDLAMPRLDGYTFLHVLKAHPQTAHIPVLLTSVRNSSEEEHRALKAGFAGFIGKPIMPVRLLAYVRTFASRNQGGPELNPTLSKGATAAFSQSP